MLDAVIRCVSAPDAAQQIRQEGLTLLARVARHHTAAFASKRRWPRDISSIIRTASEDSSAGIRSSALRVLEEVLRARAAARRRLELQPNLAAAKRVDSAVTEALGAALPVLPDGKTADGGDSRRTSAGSAGGASIGAGDTDPASDASPGPLTMAQALGSMLPQACEDPAAGVRTCALQCLAHVLPEDWEQQS